MDEVAQAPNIKKLRHYQKADVGAIFERLRQGSIGYRLLYQLPTGGGKTVVFSEIARQFILQYGQKVAILTHRIELCRQISTTLRSHGVSNKIINSTTGVTLRNIEFDCYVAMVETLKNRLKAGKFSTDGIGC